MPTDNDDSLSRLNYRSLPPPLPVTRQRWYWHRRQLVGLGLLIASAVGVVLICICSGQVSPTSDWSTGTLALGSSGTFLAMLAFPGIGLLFQRPLPVEIR